LTLNTADHSAPFSPQIELNPIIELSETTNKPRLVNPLISLVFRKNFTKQTPRSLNLIRGDW